MSSVPCPSVDAAAPSRIDVLDLFSIAQRPEQVSWQPFKTGVEIHRLYGDGVTGPSAALLRFASGGVVPLHEHTGWEHIVVLSGSQRDGGAIAEKGALLIHAPGSQHRIVSDPGCIVLAIYERPVRFLE